MKRVFVMVLLAVIGVWYGVSYVLLDPQRVPAHVFRIRRQVHSEQDFDYFQ